MLFRIAVRGGACALVLALGACSDNTTAPDASMPDLTVALPEDGGNVDFAGIDAGTSDGGDGGVDTHQPLRLPADAVPLKQDGGVDYYEIHVKPGMEQVLPG